MDGTGKVSIGKAAATSLLTVNGTIESVTGGFKFPDGTTQVTSQPWVRTSNDIYFNTGKVSFGTSSFGSQLTVQTSATNDGANFTNGARFAKIYPGTLGSGSYNSIVSANDIGIIFSNGATDTGSFVIAPWASTAGGLKILADGKVGIGISNPAYKLDVVGDINASGSVRSNGIALTSDLRFKKDIKTLDFSLERILNIHGVEYNWRQDEFPERHFSSRHQIGVIAQEVEKVFPEVVDTDAKGFKSVNYSALIAPVVEAIKSLYQKIIGIDREVASLKVENQKLKNDNELMKNYLCKKDSTASFCKP